MTRPLLTSAPAVERAQLTLEGSRYYPGMVRGRWYDLVAGTDDELGGCFLVVGGSERYVWRQWFHVESVGAPETPWGPRG